MANRRRSKAKDLATKPRKSRAKSAAASKSRSRNKKSTTTLQARLGNEFTGLLLIGCSILLVSGGFIENRGLIYVLGDYVRHAIGGTIWYLAFVLGFFGVRKFKGQTLCPGYVSLFSWLALIPVISGLFHSLSGWTSVVAPGGRVGFFVYHLLGTLMSEVSTAIILMLSLLLLLMLAIDSPLSEMVDAPGRFILAALSALLFVIWVPFVALHKVVHFILRVLHRSIYWVLEDLSTIGEYLVRTIFGRRRHTSRRLPAMASGPQPVLAENSPQAELPPPPVPIVSGDEEEVEQSSTSVPQIEEPSTEEAAPEEVAAPSDEPAPKEDQAPLRIKEMKAVEVVDTTQGDEETEEPEEMDDEDVDETPREKEDTVTRLKRRARQAKKGNQLKLFTDAGQEKKLSAIWRQPSLDLFEPAPRGKRGEADDFLQERARALIDTLAQFKIEAKVIKIVPGPTITQFQIKPASGIKLSRITALSNDLAMAMACRSVRIEAPIPGKSAVGIEVPNENPESVLFSEIVSTKSYAASRTNSILSFALGKSISGKPIIADMRKMPHLLVAGATGAGKSVCINTILASILYQARPDQVRMLMIDPKMVELVSYNNIPHLVTDVVTNPQDAGTALRWAVLEMERRYRYLSQFGVRNIDSYNRQLMDGQLFDENGDVVEDAKLMPYMVIIIDELADLMMVAAKEIESAICRLAQMARAVGMHLIIATQRPSTNVITGVIKANFPSRIAFAVSSKVDSKVILDTIGADALLGRGDMLYLPVGQAKPMRVQGAFISEEEVKRLTNFLKEQGATDYVDIHADLVEATAPPEPSERALADEMWEPALKIAVELGEVSTSLLQRHLNIGYNRAARIVDAMFERGIITGQESGRRRKVLIAEEQIRDYVS